MNRVRRGFNTVVRRAFGGIFANVPWLERWPDKDSFVVIKGFSQLVPAIVFAIITFQPDLLKNHAWFQSYGMWGSCFLLFFGFLLELVQHAAEDLKKFEEEAPLLQAQENVRNLNRLLVHSNAIVDSKSARFCKYQYAHNEDVFGIITQPEDQLLEIAKNLVGWFVNLYEGDTKFKAAIALFEGEKMVSIKAYAPWGERPSLSPPDYNDSFFAHISKLGKTDCISDIKEEIDKEKAWRRGQGPEYKSRYKESNGDNTGSVVGVPIKADVRGLVGVFVVKSKAGVFTPESVAEFTTVLHFFMVRMRLEICLMAIKEDRKRVKLALSQAKKNRRRR